MASTGLSAHGDPCADGDRARQLCPGAVSRDARRVGRVALVYYGTHQQSGDAGRTYEAYMTVSYDALDASPTLYSAALNEIPDHHGG